VYAVWEDAPDSGASLILPASPYELLDALDKLRLDGNNHVKCGVDVYYQFSSLATFLDEPSDLYELNALAQKLSELDDRQAAAFEGLLEMERRDKNGPVGLPRLIDLAYSTGCCHVIDEVLNDSQLGQFCVENGFVPGMDALPDTVFRLQDLERIGQEHRQNEGGVIVERTENHPGGYVERHGDLVEAYKTLELTPHKPDYLFQVGITHHPDAEPEYPSKVVYLELPASQETLDSLETELGDPGWLGTMFISYDGLIPAVKDMLMSTEDIPDLNRLAQKLAKLDPKALPAYKALLKTANCHDLGKAEQLMDTLDEYIFSPQFSSPIDVVKGKLSVILTEQDAALITPHLNLYEYGQSLIQHRKGLLTDYGLIERKDGQPVRAMENQSQQIGGMSLG